MFKKLFILIASLCLVTACSTSSVNKDGRLIADPMEPMNRGTWWFNDHADKYVLEPVAKGYDYVTPDSVQTGVRNFFSNIKYLQFLVSDLVQLNGSAAWSHTARFAINTTIGFLGIFDLATGMGFPENRQDFGMALGRNGVGEGYYLVIPFLGPSNTRDGFGMLVDAVLYPFFWTGATNWENSTQWIVTGTTTAVDFIQTRADLIEAVNTGRDSAVDEYLFMQGAYTQHRRNLISGKKSTDGDINEKKENAFADDVD